MIVNKLVSNLLLRKLSHFVITQNPCFNSKIRISSGQKESLTFNNHSHLSKLIESKCLSYTTVWLLARNLSKERQKSKLSLFYQKRRLSPLHSKIKRDSLGLPADNQFHLQEYRSMLNPRKPKNLLKLLKNSHNALELPLFNLLRFQKELLNRSYQKLKKRMSL